MQIPRLPMPLKDTKALTVDEGLRRTPAVRPIELAYETFDAKATLPMSNTSNDDATANDKQFAIAVRDPGHRRTCTSRMRCNLHKIKHVETALTTMIGVSLIGQLFGHAKALRTGNYWFRLCTSVESFVDKYLEFDIACPIETGIEEYAAEFLDYMCAQFKCRQLLYEASVAQDDSDRAMQSRASRAAYFAFRRAWDNCLKLLNGALWKKSLCHFCKNNFACCGFNRATCVQKITAALLATLLHHKPSIPSSIKWNALGPSLDFVVAGIVLYNLLPKLYTHAFNDIAVEVAKRAELALAGQGTIGFEYVQHLCWHVIASTRLSNTLAFVHSKASVRVILMLTVVMEPLRFLIAWLTHRSATAKDQTRPPALFDLVNTAYSPVLIARQYLSDLLRGRGSRLVLIFRRDGASSFREWVLKNESAAIDFQRMILTLDGWLYRKFWHDFNTENSWPWRAALLGDQRAPTSTRMRVAEQITQTPECCLDEFFLRRLLWLFPGLQATSLVFDVFFTHAFFLWALNVAVTIVFIENRLACQSWMVVLLVLAEWSSHPLITRIPKHLITNH